MLSAVKVADYLRRHGFPVISHSEPDDIEDGMVEVTALVHVQVGSDHYTVVREQDGKFWFGEMRENVALLVPDLRQAIMASGENVGNSGEGNV